MRRILWASVVGSAVLGAACSAGSGPGNRLGGSVGSGSGGQSGWGVGVLPPGTGGSLIITGSVPDGAVAPTPEAGPVLPPNGPVNIDECLPTNTAGLDAAAAQKLMAGSGGPGNLRWLNPYDGTVFPRGLIAPQLMWDGGGTADAVYVHIQSSRFEYKGCFKPTGTNQLQLPQAIWDEAGAATGGANDPFTVELTTSVGGTAMGPIAEKIIVAQATLKGSIFYNTYKSQLVKPTDLIGVFTGGQGAVLRITPGQKAVGFLGITSCTGCHSVSANGSRLVANPNVNALSGGATYAIDVNAAPNPTPLVPNASGGSFSGVYPDGSLYLSNAHPGGMGPRAGVPGVAGDPTATLYETDTGKVVPNTGIPTGAMTPMFSPDGSMLVFNDYAIGNGHGLALMNFDKASRKASGYRQLYQVTDTLTYPGWPFFLPDNKGLVFAIGSANDFSGNATGLMGPLVGATSDLFVLDLASGTAKILAKAMGFNSEQDAASGSTYLPYGPTELHHNFYPTASPVAAGGYFWVFFDSYRHYGNTHADIGGLVRQLWGAAVDISPDGTYKADPSHPPFYLTGQEDVLGNHRAFAALDPCRKDGDDCATGIDCCGGFCTDAKCGVPPPPPMGGPVCAHTDESCANGNPCCNPEDRCLAGFCGQIIQ